MDDIDIALDDWATEVLSGVQEDSWNADTWSGDWGYDPFGPDADVWDYESDEATIPFTTEALIDRCISWINE
jgi:hypothetical protein